MDKNLFLIPLNGLSHGRMTFRMEVGKEFFESFENSEILDADLQAEVETEKSGQYIGIDCHISGTVSVACDRCLEPLTVPVETEARLSVKFGTGGEDDGDEDGSSDREIVWLPKDNTDFDLAQVIYDYVCLSLPLLRMHPEGECNPQVMRYIRSGISVSDAENAGSDSPFAALKGLFGN